MTDAVQRVLKVCCERECDNPVDRPRSRVRCADHYTPPAYDPRSTTTRMLPKKA